MSLPNAAETFAAGVWRQYFPREDVPPIWIGRMLADEDSPTPEYTTSSADTAVTPSLVLCSMAD